LYDKVFCLGGFATVGSQDVLTHAMGFSMNQKTVLRILGTAGLCVLLFLALAVLGSYHPVADAVPAAQSFARSNNFVTDGYFGTILEEPDIFGGCTVLIGFTDATKTPPQQIRIILKRQIAFGSWHVKDHTTNVWIYDPVGSMSLPMTLPSATAFTTKNK
jgi:hypothetical protein